MASLSIDWVGADANPPYRALITIPQDYDHMNEVSAGVLYELDTDALWADLKALEESEVGIVFKDLQARNAAYTVAGTTYAPAVFMQCDVTFEDLGALAVYTVQLVGTNNDLWLPKNAGGNLVTQPNVVVSPGNSAGLQLVQSTDGQSIEAKLDQLIADQELTQEMIEAERTTQASVAPIGNPGTPGKVVLRNITVSKRWEADAWEDEAQQTGYRGQGLESVGMFFQVAWS